MNYLDGLNDAQRRAVLATEGPVSVLAGAGSGKTRVLTLRIYHLIRQGVAPDQILAVTFTNKAAREMRERVRKLLGEEGSAPQAPRSSSTLHPPTSPLPFVATFHGLGRELLESYGKVMGVPRYFSVFDRDDSERVIAKALKDLDVSVKELSPRSVLSKISKAKGEGISAAEFNEKQGRSSFGNRIAALAWLAYEKELAAEKALDFDDLIVKPVRLLENHPDVLAAAQARWRYLHIDEFQDTNALQARLVNLLARMHQNVFVVGDIDQCLVGGTKVRMADGEEKPIEKIHEGDLVLSNHGSGAMRSARVSRVVTKTSGGELIRIVTKKGRTLTSTPEHMHFAGYRLGQTPQLFFTYLMHKRAKGWRVGVSQVYTRGQVKPMIGFQQRCNQEHADDVWIIGAYDSPQEARVREYQVSLEYRLPTLPFVARKGSSANGYVHDQAVIDRIFATFDTDASARALLAEEGLSLQYPHHRASSLTGYRRNIILTLCGDGRGMTPMHRVTMVGKDSGSAAILRAAGFSIRRTKKNSESWRFETIYAKYGDALAAAETVRALLPDSHILEVARLGGHKERPQDGNYLPFLPAGSVQRGMALFDEEGRWDIVETVERVRGNRRVYDIDVERTHNFIANGLVTHNCIYTWRGATIDNLLSFDRQYPGAQTIILEHNYRSTKTIVDAANRIIEENKNRKEKRSVTDNPAGAPIVVHAALSAEHEARWIARNARELMRGGMKPEDIAILYRTNFQSRALEEGLLREGVPYKLLGTRFFERKEVKDALAWMRLALEPTREADKVRAAASPPRGIGKVLLGKLAAGQRGTLKGAENAKVEKFEQAISELARAAETLAPSEFVKLVVEKSGMKRVLYDEGSEEDRERFENVEELASVAARHDGIPGKEGIAAFLADAALASDQDELDRTDKKGVTLLTVHAAKGLEFKVVFVSGMEEGLFPHEGMGDGDRDEEEERRLFYVAVTRAGERLFLTLARIRKIYGTDILSEPSSFLQDLDRSSVIYDEDDGDRVIEI